MSEIPDLLRLDKIPVSYEQLLETSLLEPSTFQAGTSTQDGFASFILERKGFLHSHSKLFLSIQPSDTNARAFLPQNIGIASVIRRATLRAGNAVINEIDDWSHLHMIKSAEIDNENNVEREQYVTGRTANLRYLYREFNAGVQSFNVNNSRYSGPDNSREYGTNGEDLEVLPFANMAAAALDQCPVYSVDVSDLFPFLKTHSLPLYMIDQELTIELTFVNTLSRACLPLGANQAVQYTIDRNELKFCADYIFYTENDVMQRYADANPSLEFAFPDYRLSKQSVVVDSGAAPPAQPLNDGIIRNIGMANRLVSRVLTTITNDALTMVSINGKYVSQAPERAGNPATNPGTIRYNVRYNDRFEYPIDIINPAQLFSNFTQAESLLFRNREEYSNQQGGLGGSAVGNNTMKFEGNDVNTALAGKSFFLGTKLTNGRVGSRGIELHYTGTNYADASYTVRCYSEYLRIAKLSQGGFTIMNV
tara:strand:- start:125 stop:1558 length:1434 start_codon:yes stop_codon:yes gene_type:complete